MEDNHNAVVQKVSNSFFYVVLLCCCFGFTIFFLNVLPNTRKFSEDAIRKLTHLVDKEIRAKNLHNLEVLQSKNIRISSELSNWITSKHLPFSLDFISESDSQDFIYGIYQHYSLYSSYDVMANRTLDLNQDFESLPIPSLFRHINIWILRKVDISNKYYEEDKEIDDKFSNRLLSILSTECAKSKFFAYSNVTLKNLYHSEEVESQDFYEDLLSMNSNYAIEEIADNRALNIIIKFGKSWSESFEYYNADLGRYLIIVNKDLRYNGHEAVMEIITQELMKSAQPLSLPKELANRIPFEATTKFLYYSYLFNSLKNLNTLNVGKLFINTCRIFLLDMTL